MSLACADIDVLCELIYELCGLDLDESKAYLLESRLSEILASRGCDGFGTLVRHVRADATGRLAGEVIDAITTNETLFFRDSSPFEALEYKVLPELIDAKASTAYSRRLRIWSAACSTGQEAYSIAMTLCDLIPDALAWDINILGTDISDAAVAQASRGIYSPHEIDRGLPAAVRDRYFEPQSGGWKICDKIRSLVQFQRMNLLALPAALGPFDVIFCRNVAIYFSPEDRRKLFTALAACLSPGGYLFVGSSESLSDLGPQYRPLLHCRSVFYRPNLCSAAL